MKIFCRLSIAALILLFFLPPVWSQDVGLATHDELPAHQRVFLGEVVAKPELLIDVVAPLWGRMELAKGIYAGARVKEGQTMATITLELSAEERLPLEDRTLQIDGFLERAQQKLRFALADYQRAVRIRAENPDFEDEVERRKAIYENALLEFQQASRQRTTQMGVIKSRDPKVVVITAPISGYIRKIHFVPGEVNPTDQFRKLFTLVNLSTVLVRTEAFETDLETLQKTRRVLVEAPALGPGTMPGVFLAFGDKVDPETRTIPIYFEVPNPGERLRIGLPVRVRPVQVEP